MPVGQRLRADELRTRAAFRGPRPRGRVSVVIPAKNEARNIGWVLERIPIWVDEVVLVDGRSTDRTIEVARALRPDIVVVADDEPGKGAALRAGFAAATGDFVVMLDADGSMDPGEIENFVALLATGHDLVKGSRFAPGGGTADISLLRSAGNPTGSPGDRVSQLRSPSPLRRVEPEYVPRRLAGAQDPRRRTAPASPADVGRDPDRERAHVDSDRARGSPGSFDGERSRLRPRGADRPGLG